MIHGIGVDVVSIPRIAQALSRHGERFARRVFTERERQYCERRRASAESYAARFAAKEATIKTLGGSSGLRWRDMEVARGQRGAPSLVLHGRAAELARARGIERWHLSLAHDAQTAIAFVVAES